MVYSEKNAWRRDYDRNRYRQRRKELIAKFGGKCVQCGSTNRLEFDHRDRSAKSFDPSKGWAKPLSVLEKELEKCQLLCRPCHHLKTLGELGRHDAKRMHGTVSSYTYCRCDECRAAHSARCKEYRKTYVRPSRAKK